MADDLRGKLKLLIDRDDRSLREIDEAAGLGISRQSLSRKLNGNQPMTVDEAAAIASVLGYDLRLSRRRRAA